MRIVISIPMEKNRDSHFCKNRAALIINLVYCYRGPRNGSEIVIESNRMYLLVIAGQALNKV